MYIRKLKTGSRNAYTLNQNYNVNDLNNLKKCNNAEL